MRLKSRLGVKPGDYICTLCCNLEIHTSAFVCSNIVAAKIRWPLRFKAASISRDCKIHHFAVFLFSTSAEHLVKPLAQITFTLT